MDRPFVRRFLTLFALTFAPIVWAEEPRIQARVQSAPAPIPFDGDIDRLAAQSPDQFVATTGDFIEATTIEQIATLVFSEKIEALSVYIGNRTTDDRAKLTSHSFSVAGPPREDQLARARCQSLYSSEQASSGESADARAEFIHASVLLPAHTAQRWINTPPAIVERTKVMSIMRDAQISSAKEIMHNVLTMRLPVLGTQKVPPQCETYIYLMQR
jgi:hypothetical protein